MFSWGKSSSTAKKRSNRRGGDSTGPTLNEFGIPINQESGGNDEELEAELRALTGGIINVEEDFEINDDESDVEAEFEKMFGQSKNKKKSKNMPKNREKMDESAKISVDLDLNGDDDPGDDVDVDENDPELLGELMGLTEENDEDDLGEEEGGKHDESNESKPEKEEVTITSLLKERLNMYKAAEAKAKENNESSRARRFSRGIKTLQQLIKKAEAGKPVLTSEIPPVIATNLKPAPAQPSISLSEMEPSSADVTDPENHLPVEETQNLSLDDATHTTTDNEMNESRDTGTEKEIAAESRSTTRIIDNPLTLMMRTRREEYKTCALAAKRRGDLEIALNHVKCIKQLDGLLAAAEMGEEINEKEIPPSPNSPPPRKVAENVTPLKFEAPQESDNYDIPTTVLEALNQRLGIYERFLREARIKGDEAAAKRNEKITHIYREAIKLHKNGRKLPLGKLPTPPGCPPIPIPFQID